MMQTSLFFACIVTYFVGISSLTAGLRRHSCENYFSVNFDRACPNLFRKFGHNVNQATSTSIHMSCEENSFPRRCWRANRDDGMPSAILSSKTVQKLAMRYSEMLTVSIDSPVSPNTTTHRTYFWGALKAMKQLLFRKRSGDSPDTFTYSSSVERGSHIVDQSFPYKRRIEEEKLVCNFMTARQKSRNATTAGRSYSITSDHNPLIVIPGSPGSGKSTFLANFPDSPEFHKYTRDHSIVDVGAVVSTITFNSGMGSGAALVGLRILYGAAKSMGLDLKEHGVESWRRFLGAYSDYSSLTAKQAVEVLQLTFGKDRRILLLIDEIMKAKKDGEGAVAGGYVLSQLVEVLDIFGNVDILVSSLSPTYIDSLFTVSYARRRIEYVAASPLLEAPSLGRVECETWANRTIELAEQQGITVPPAVKRFLRNLYIVHSGHPRSLEIMMEGAFNTGFIERVIIEGMKALERRGETVSFNTLLFESVSLEEGGIRGNLVSRMAIQRYTPSLSLMSFSRLERFVFSADCNFVAEDKGFGNILQSAKVFIQRTVRRLRPYRVQFRVAVPALSLLKWISELPRLRVPIPEGKYPCTEAAAVLFTGLKSEQDVATWWRRFVAVNIVSSSFVKEDIAEVFGLPSRLYLGANTNQSGIYPVIAPAGGGYKALPLPAEDNLLTVFNDAQAGFDAHTFATGKHFYLQVNIQFPKNNDKMAGEEEERKKTTSEMAADSLPFVIINHLSRYLEKDRRDLLSQFLSPAKARTIDLSDVHFVIYNWGDEGGEGGGGGGKEQRAASNKPLMREGVQMLLNKERPSSRVKQYVTDKKLPGFRADLFDKAVYDYIDNHFENIRIVNRTYLRKWLLPTFVPFAVLFAAIGPATDKED